MSGLVKVKTALIFLAIVLGLIFGLGCAGQFPTTRAGARALFCEKEACPAEADNFGAYLVEQSAGVDGCTCVMTDGENEFAITVPYARW
jgi:hypothetical protein